MNYPVTVNVVLLARLQNIDEHRSIARHDLCERKKNVKFFCYY